MSIVQSKTHNRAPINERSHVVGAATPALSERTISDWLDATAAAQPDRTACVFCEQGVRLSWAELREQSDRLAAGLVRLGFVKGDRIGIWSPNRVEWLWAQYATARIGVILVNINPAYRIAELEYALGKVGAKGIITAAAFKTSDYLSMLATVAAKLPQLTVRIRMGSEHTAGMMNLDAVMANVTDAEISSVRATSSSLTATDAINVQFTSGTTGNPKGATLTHHNVVNNAIFVATTMGLTQHDSLCVPVPLYHCFGMVMSSLACAVTGATMVFPSEGFEPLATLRAIAAERCTHLHGVPTMFIAELDHPEFASFDLTSLRGGIMAGSPCPVAVMQRVNQHMHMTEVTIAYGMTETSPVSFQSGIDDPVEKRVSTVGRILPHLEVKVVDPDGNAVPVGQAGELWTRGYSVMLGYWDEPVRTAESIVDGWMRTGDLATLDADGYCNIVGRVKDMLIRGGENVYPREIEEFLFRHPKVAQVQVFGVPDKKYGEAVCAWIVLKPDTPCSEDEIRAFCQDQIAHYKVPRYVRFVEALPMTVTGKAQKFVMRETMMKELGLVAEATA